MSAAAALSAELQNLQLNFERPSCWSPSARTPNVLFVIMRTDTSNFDSVHITSQQHYYLYTTSRYNLFVSFELSRPDVSITRIGPCSQWWESIKGNVEPHCKYKSNQPTWNRSCSFMWVSSSSTASKLLPSMATSTAFTGGVNVSLTNELASLADYYWRKVASSYLFLGLL